MQSLLILAIYLITISIVVIAVIRIRLKKKFKELSENLNNIFTYSEKYSYEQAKEKLSKSNYEKFIDIPTNLNNEFCGRIISASQERNFINH